MKKEFIVERQGKSFVLYSGLLDEAHAHGLKSITTSLQQAPNDANGQTAICIATVEMENGRVFTGIGDASPANVNEMMRNCLIRMAETRAKARALRDAVNVGVVALEELEEAGDYAPTGTAAPPSRAKVSGIRGPEAGRAKTATEPQLRAIYSIAQTALGMDQRQVEEESRLVYGVAPAALTKEQASTFIDRLKSEVRKRPAA